MGAALAGKLARERTPPARVAVFRALQLGDLLCAVPALRALRNALPQARIVLIGLPWARDFVGRYAHLCDDFLAFPGFPGLPERVPDLAALPGFLREAHAHRFDVAIQLHGRGDITNPLVVALGARTSAGFCAPDGYCPDAERYATWPEQGHEIERLLTLIDFLGIPRDGTALEFPLAAAEVAQATALRAAHGLAARRYACIHPGARLASRRWPPEHFVAVGATLARAGLRIVVTGTAEESALTARIARGVPGAIDLAGRTPLGVLAALLRDARMLVCNDTGVSHVAAAVQTPSVVVSCGADPARFAPLDALRHEVVWQPVPCRPCAHDRCPVGHPCAVDLRPSRVIDRVIARLLATAPAEPAPLRRAS